jgi:hypothetical protein
VIWLTEVAPSYSRGKQFIEHLAMGRLCIAVGMSYEVREGPMFRRDLRSVSRSLPTTRGIPHTLDGMRPSLCNHEGSVQNPRDIRALVVERRYSRGLGSLIDNEAPFMDRCSQT